MSFFKKSLYVLKDPCAYKKLSVHENIAEKSEICVKTGDDQNY